MSTAHATTTGTDRRADDKMLRTVLLLDGVITAVNGLAYVALATFLLDLLGYPKAVQYPVGAFLLVYGAAVLFTATRPVVSRSATAAYAVINVLWTVLSLAVVATDVLPTTTIGTVWVVLQALVVGGFAVLQFIALRRTPTA